MKRMTSIVLLICINASVYGMEQTETADLLRAWVKDHPYVSLILKNGSNIQGQLKDVGDNSCLIQDDKSEITVLLSDITEVKKIKPPKKELILTVVISAAAVLGFWLYHYIRR